jgi:hypothetical protein
MDVDVEVLVIWSAEVGRWEALTPTSNCISNSFEIKRSI